MKRLFLLLALAGVLPQAMRAQSDDVYFSPDKTSDASDDKPAYYCGSNRSVDEYNRRGQLRSMYQNIGRDSLGNDIVTFYPGMGIRPDSAYVDTAYVGRAWGDDDYVYTRRMSRWDGYYDPWFYGYYSPWRWGYSRWYSPWYYGYAGWYDPWYYDYAGWYDPWYYGYAGWYDPWYYGWGYPYYYGGWYDWGWPRGGYVYRDSNPRGYTGSRSWSFGGRSYGYGGQAGTGRYNGSANSNSPRSIRNRSFGRTTFTPPARSNANTNFGTTRSSSFGSFGGGGSVGGSFGGARGGGGGGHFGGGRR